MNMYESHDELITHALDMITTIDDSFLDLGELLRFLQLNDMKTFHTLLSFPQLGRRKGYYLAKINRTFGHLNIDKERLLKIGWTKLQMVTAYVNDENYEDYLALAEELKAYNLANVLKGKMMVANGRTIVMYLSPAQYKVFESGVVKFGAIVNGRGIIDKEKALMKALKANK